MKFLSRVLKNLQIFKFHGSLPSGSRVASWDGETDRQTGMKKLTVAYRNFANVPK